MILPGRGNVSSTKRYDVTNLGQYVTLTVRYNTAGSVAGSTDPSNHQSSIGYGDSFSVDGINISNPGVTTLAFPTTVTDADGYSSTIRYNYDFGAVTRTHSPTSGTSSITYIDITRSYDAYGRLQQITNQTNGAYTKFVYDATDNYIQTYQTIIDTQQANEFHSWQVMDGAGRVRATASDLPGSSGGYSGTYVVYDNMGRVSQQSNPTEMTTSWTPSGPSAWSPTGSDPAWQLTQQSYDWKGRPLQTTYPDTYTKVLSYGGCGCAGGEVTTATDEHGRQKRYTKDALSRMAKVEELNWNGSVYATTTYSYDARDQIKEINQAGQIRSFTYDGHGRLSSRTTPEQGATSYSYNPDDTINVITDARQTTTTFGYNARHLVT